MGNTATLAGEQADAIFGSSEAEVRAALDQASPLVLRMALYQGTRDPSLETMEVLKAPFWGGAFQIGLLSDEDGAIVREKALDWLKDLSAGKVDSPPFPDENDLPALMGMMLDQPFGPDVDIYAYDMSRGDLLDEEFPLGVEWNSEPSAEVKAAQHVLVVGAGLAGLSTAIQLDRLGLPWTIVDRNGGIGGTWWVNQYPEARVDIASHNYQYTFMKHYPWKHFYATGAELREYAEHVATKFDLHRNIRLNTLLDEAVWDEEAGVWHCTLTNPDGTRQVLAANAIVSAAGIFNAPKFPEIKGIESFAGDMFHTTEWDHTVPLEGRRIGQIGTGSTGVQLSAAVAEKAGHMTIYQRSPQWINPIEGYKNEITREMQWLFDHVPHYWGWYSFWINSVNNGDPTGLQNYDREWQAQGGLVSKRNDSVREFNISYMTEKLRGDPYKVGHMIPDFPPFTKRPVVDNDFLEALNRDNVDIVFGPIREITPRGVVSPDGTEREFDVLLLCAGFDVQRFLWPVAYKGVGGKSLEEAWSKDGARAYLGMTMPDFPNLFMIYGPNGQARAGGLIKWLEVWSRYALRSIVAMVESGKKAIEVKREVCDAYNARVDEGDKETIFNHPGQHSYMQNEHGRLTISMPWLPKDYYGWVRAPDLADYDLR
jgi:4-hydroxyacetophenone monooxygenase